MGAGYGQGKRKVSKPKPGERRRALRRGRDVAVGQLITCPAAVASGGVIRVRSARAAEVARMFRLATTRPDAVSAVPPVAATPALDLRPGTITLIVGASGAGKSTLLRAARASGVHADRSWIDLATIADASRDLDLPIVDRFRGLSLRDTLALLARVGLGEVWSYLRTSVELSDGQRWRFRLALALHGASHGADGWPVIACDEFAALLDRVTACMVAHRLRQAIDAMPHAAAVVATSHDDLAAALAPDVVVRCDFGTYDVMRSPS